MTSDAGKRAAGQKAAGERAAGDKAGRDQGGPDQAAGERAASPALSYEQARDELTEVVRRLEAGGLTLEQSLELWERGERLAAICSQWLEGARARLAAAISGKPGPSGGT